VTGGIVLLPHESSVSIPSPCPSPGGRGNAYPHARRSRSSVLPSRADMLLDRAQDALGSVRSSSLEKRSTRPSAAPLVARSASRATSSGGVGSATRRQLPPRVAHRRRRSRRRAPDRVLPSELRIGDRSPPKRRPQALSAGVEAARNARARYVDDRPTGFVLPPPLVDTTSSRVAGLPTTRRACGEARPLPPGEGTGRG